MGYQITKDTKLTGEEIIKLLNARKFGINTKNSDSIIGIYQIKNLINDKKYIGSSYSEKGGIKTRWQAHIRKLQKNKHHSLYLQNSWNKYGAKNFEFSILEIINKNDFLDNFKEKIRKKEQYYINFYETYKKEKGYNVEPIVANGGGVILTEDRIKYGKTKINWDDYLKMKDLLINTNIPLKQIAKRTNIRSDLVIKIYNRKALIKEYENIIFPIRETKGDKLLREKGEEIVKKYEKGMAIKNIAKENDTTDSVIKRILNKKGIKIRNALETECVKIYQYDMQGNFLKEYSSIAEATKENKISNGKITTCAKGERKSVNGFRWSYEKKDNLDLNTILEKIIGRPYSKKNRPLIQYSLDNIPLTIFGSLRSTQPFLGAKYIYLGKKINKEGKTKIYDFYWEYLDTLEEKELLNIFNLKQQNQIKIVDNIFNSIYKNN